jgi:hypothetical protein
MFDLNQRPSRTLRFFSMIPSIGLSLFLAGCNPHGFSTDLQSSDASSLGGSPSTPGPGTPSVPNFKYEPLAWESSTAKERKAWSTLVFRLLRNEAKDVLEADDFSIFCPNYPSLSLDQKVNVAGMLVSGITRFESNFDPLTRFQESTMGVDAVTGRPVFSEGLLQLSYQDTIAYPFCDFNWNADKDLSPTDPHKTILDPFNNLACGVQILAKQIRNRGSIVLESGVYWAVIRKNGANEKINEIATIVQKLSFCQ